MNLPAPGVMAIGFRAAKLFKNYLYETYAYDEIVLNSCEKLVINYL